MHTTGSRTESGFSYTASTSSMRATYSSSSSATHHIFFPPRFQVVAFEQDSNRLSSHPWHQLALHRLLGEQAHRPPCPALGRRTADQGNDALPLLGIQSCLFPRSRPLIHGSLEPALLIALAGQPNRLRGQAHVAGYLTNRLPIRQLSQYQGSQHGSYRLQTAAQQVIQLLLLRLGQPNLNFPAVSHVPAIRLDIFPDKYLNVLLFMWSQY